MQHHRAFPEYRAVDAVVPGLVVDLGFDRTVAWKKRTSFPDANRCVGLHNLPPVDGANGQPSRRYAEMSTCSTSRKHAASQSSLTIGMPSTRASEIFRIGFFTSCGVVTSVVQLPRALLMFVQPASVISAWISLCVPRLCFPEMHTNSPDRILP